MGKSRRPSHQPELKDRTKGNPKHCLLLYHDGSFCLAITTLLFDLSLRWVTAFGHISKLPDEVSSLTHSVKGCLRIVLLSHQRTLDMLFFLLGHFQFVPWVPLSLHVHLPDRPG